MIGIGEADICEIQEKAVVPVCGSPAERFPQRGRPGPLAIAAPRGANTRSVLSASALRTDWRAQVRRTPPRASRQAAVDLERPLDSDARRKAKSAHRRPPPGDRSCASRLALRKPPGTIAAASVVMRAGMPSARSQRGGAARGDGTMASAARSGYDGVIRSAGSMRTIGRLRRRRPRPGARARGTAPASAGQRHHVGGLVRGRWRRYVVSEVVPARIPVRLGRVSGRTPSGHTVASEMAANTLAESRFGHNHSRRIRLWNSAAVGIANERVVSSGAYSHARQRQSYRVAGTSRQGQIDPLRGPGLLGIASGVRTASRSARLRLRAAGHPRTSPPWPWRAENSSI